MQELTTFFDIQDSDLDPAALINRLRNPRFGALVTFEGWVRNHNEGADVERLEYEAYGPLAEKEAQTILRDAVEQFDVSAAGCVHRVGSLAIGGLAVWIGVVAEHRSDAFGACQMIIDQVKLRVPVWKKEHYTDGRAEWVACHHCAHPHD